MFHRAEVSFLIDVFLSYQNEDRRLAETLSKALLDMGYSVWWDVNLLPGDDFQSEITSVIENAKTVIVLWTSKAVNSHFVRDEATLALKLKKLISTSYDIEIDEIPLGFKQTQTLDIKPAFDAPKFSLPDDIIQAIEKKVGSESPVEHEPTETENLKLEAGPPNQIQAWKKIESKKYDKSSYENFLEKYGHNTPLSVVAHNRISEHQNKKTGSLQRLLFWVLIMPGALIALYLNTPKLIEKLNSSTEAENVESNPSDPKPVEREALEKKKESQPKTAKVLPTSVSPKKVLDATSSDARYKGWRVPDNSWFGKVNDVTILSGNESRVFLSSIPDNISIFVTMADLPPNIDKNDYVKIAGEIDGVTRYITLEKGSVIKTNRASVYRRFREDYDDVVCVQKKMSEYGYYDDFIDGISGPYTNLAIDTFLKKSPILKELSLTKNSTSTEICNALKDLSLKQYSKIVSDKYSQAWIDRMEKSNQEYQSDYKPLSETFYERMLDSDKEAWDKAVRSSKVIDLYNYLNGDYVQIVEGNRARLEKTDFRINNKRTAQEKLGISFDPRIANPPSIFINTDKQMGVTYSFKISVEKDSNYLFHEGADVHGVSTCLNSGLLSQCYADGICSEKDYKTHVGSSIKTCVPLETQVTFLGGVLSSKVNEDLCSQYSRYINARTGHYPQAWVQSPYGYDICTLHYSKEELNRILSK